MSENSAAVPVLVTRDTWIEQLIAAVRPVLPPSFIGNIEINASEGASTASATRVLQAGEPGARNGRRALERAGANEVGDDAPPPAWLDSLVAAMRTLISKEFVGQIEVNVFKGGISNVNLKQSWKPAGATTRGR